MSYFDMLSMTFFLSAKISEICGQKNQWISEFQLKTHLLQIIILNQQSEVKEIQSGLKSIIFLNLLPKLNNIR